MFAMIIYGIILFPPSMGIIDLQALSVFLAVECHHVNPVTIILAETYISLNLRHAKKGGKLSCCLPLLNIWLLNHVYRKKCYAYEKHDQYANPLTIFKNQEGLLKLDRKGWTEFFE